MKAKYAVIFRSKLKQSHEGYDEMAIKMEVEVSKMPGFVEMIHARNEIGITICYWTDLKSIENWKNQSSHREAQQKGKDLWYQFYQLEVVEILKSYDSGKSE